MTHQLLPLADTLNAPPLFFDYIAQKETLNELFGLYPNIENFETQIEQKSSFDAKNRQVLVETLHKQYKKTKEKPDIDSLANPNTFTVTTGHQLNIFTGPLYVIYKIVTAITLARKLKASYPAYNFVPVYWMASEDHDFAEISSFNLFGKKYNWQSEQKGAVGRMNPRELGEALKILPERVSVFEQAYLKHNTLADAVRYYMHELFGAEGLVCIDADDAALKALFRPVIEDELQQRNSHKIVENTTRNLEKLGYEAIISPRQINLFYLENGLRERIVYDNNGYQVLNTNLQFSEEEILALAQTSPEKFSPNVCLRPLYQEVILPNLAYIGGPSEVPYWLQLKGVFEHFELPFPILMPRNFALYINASTQKRIEKLDLTTAELFQDELTLRKAFIEKNTTVSLSLNDERMAFEKLFHQIVQKTELIDKTLEGAVLAEKTKLLSSLENLEKRIQKAEERNHETEISQITGLKTKLFPNGGAQERTDNFLNFYLNDNSFIQKLLGIFDPLDFRFNVITEV
jgi:bacillithiol synthase